MRTRLPKLPFPHRSRPHTDPRGIQGITVGPALSNSLKRYFGAKNVATQGVDYLALPITNLFNGGGPTHGIQKMQQLLSQATILCPNSFVVAAGYRYGDLLYFFYRFQVETTLYVPSLPLRGLLS